MEAVKERPPTRTGKEAKKQVVHSLAEQLNAKQKPTPQKELQNSVVQISKDQLNSQVTNTLLPPTSFDTSTTETSATTAGVGSFKPKDYIPMTNISQDTSRISPFLIYPIYINITTANWEKMCNFYEEVLELPTVRHPDIELSRINYMII